MLDAHSPLDNLARFEANGISIAEEGGFELCQYAGDEKILKKSLGKIPVKVGVALVHEDRCLFRIAPRQVWVLGAEVSTAAGLYKTQLFSGRCRLRLEGAKVRELLLACAVIDFDANKFKPGHFVMTGIHHTPIVIHCTGTDIFHIYVLRTFALAVWEWLTDAAIGLEK